MWTLSLCIVVRCPAFWRRRWRTWASLHFSGGRWVTANTAEDQLWQMLVTVFSIPSSTGSSSLVMPMMLALLFTSRMLLPRMNWRMMGVPVLTIPLFQTEKSLKSISTTNQWCERSNYINLYFIRCSTSQGKGRWCCQPQQECRRWRAPSWSWGGPKRGDAAIQPRQPSTVHIYTQLRLPCLYHSMCFTLDRYLYTKYSSYSSLLSLSLCGLCPYVLQERYAQQHIKIFMVRPWPL